MIWDVCSCCVGVAVVSQSVWRRVTWGSRAHTRPPTGTAWASLNRFVLCYTRLRLLHVIVPHHIHRSPIARLDISSPPVEEGGLKRLGNLSWGSRGDSCRGWGRVAHTTWDMLLCQLSSCYRPCRVILTVAQLHVLTAAALLSRRAAWKGLVVYLGEPAETPVEEGSDRP